MKQTAGILLSLLFSAACSSVPPVNMSAPRRVVGTERSVRIDAEISEEMRIGGSIAITYVITNQRNTAIAVADVTQETTFESETRTMTVNIGAEVPGETVLPRLLRIGPGENRRFATTARMARAILPASADPRVPNRALLRLKINFLGDTAPFAELLDIPGKSIADKQRADALFTPWLEGNEVLYTNAIPVLLTSPRAPGTEADAGRGAPPPAPRRRRIP